MKTDVAFTVRMSEKLYGLIQRTALYEDRSMSQIVRRAVQQYCQDMMELSDQEKG